MKIQTAKATGETLWLKSLVAGLPLLTLMAVTVVAGCGGGGGGTAIGGSGATSTAGQTTGRAIFTVVWPAATRLIPAASTSIKVEMLRANAVIATQTLVKPSSGGTSSITFADLPVDTLTIRATAYPQPDATGTAQATGSVPVTIVADQTVSFGLTMNSTIDHITVSPASASLTAGSITTLIATAMDAPVSSASADIVLVSSAAYIWSSSNTDVATVDTSGIVMAIAAGRASITVKDNESGKTATVNVVVTATSPSPTPTPTPTPTATATPDPFAGIHQYLTIDPNSLLNYANPTYPVHYDATVLANDNTPATNRVTNIGATLGRVLFFDKNLSINNTVACASCHQQSTGMTDSRQFSLGFDGVDVTAKHAMRLGNVRFYAGQSMFWDKRAASVEAQATQPIQNSVEMGFDATHGGIDALITKMATLPYYSELFKLVYGDSTITEDRIQRALAQYERSMVSTSSRFDTEFAKVYNANAPGKGIGANFAGFTAQENRGKQLFLAPPNQGGGGCAGCHQTPTFALDPNSRSNGLDAGETTLFKSPSLKNIALTGPYMHDGRFTTLEQCVDHYISGVQAGPALDNRLKGPGGQPQQLNLTAADRDAIVAFLKTLNDTSLTADPKFASPFK